MKEQKEQEPKPQVIRIAYQYDNGKVRFLEGLEAQTYLDYIHSCEMERLVRRKDRVSPKFDWKEIEGEEAENLFKKTT